MYDNPPAAVAFSDGIKVPEHLLVDAINHFETFYEEVYLELAKFGEVEELHVLDNIGEHMIGNVYAKFYQENDALQALKGLNGRFYSGKPIKAEYCPVTDFNESRCRLFTEGSCDRNYKISLNFRWRILQLHALKTCEQRFTERYATSNVFRTSRIQR